MRKGGAADPGYSRVTRCARQAVLTRYDATMPSVGSTFTALERAVLQAICEAYPADRLALGAQLSTVRSLSRENTGAGFYTRFSVQRSPETAISGERVRRGPAVRVDGLQHGLGFLLWLDEGFASCLEAYSFGENTGAIAFDQLRFEIVRQQ